MRLAPRCSATRRQEAAAASHRLLLLLALKQALLLLLLPCAVAFAPAAGSASAAPAAFTMSPARLLIRGGKVLHLNEGVRAYVVETHHNVNTISSRVRPPVPHRRTGPVHQGPAAHGDGGGHRQCQCCRGRAARAVRRHDQQVQAALRPRRARADPERQLRVPAHRRALRSARRYGSLNGTIIHHTALLCMYAHTHTHNTHSPRPARQRAWTPRSRRSSWRRPKKRGSPSPR